MGKKSKFIFTVAGLLFIHFFIKGQNHTINGYVKDADTGEALIGATIYLTGQKTGTTTNTYGYYSLRSNQDSVQLIYSFIGYSTRKFTFYLDQDTTLNIFLSPDSRQLSEIVIEQSALENQFQQIQMSLEQIDVKQARTIPVIFGEADLIKVLQLKPGVQSGNEGSSGLFVRGGDADQNLFLLDEAKVYNPDHLFGYFSIFNPDVVNSLEMYKGGFPAKFGGKLSSVVDVKLREGNQKKLAGRGGIGLIASRLTLEGPIIKDKASYLVSGRRTYFDLITRQINKYYESDQDFNKIPDYFFYDLNTKINYNLNKNNRIFLSGYFGRDVFGFAEDFNFDFFWGNTSGTARWNHIFNPRLFMNASLIFSDYRYSIRNTFDDFSLNLNSFIRDYNAKLDFDYTISNKHSLFFGMEYFHHNFLIGRLHGGSDDGEISFKAGDRLTAQEVDAYISDNISLSPRLNLESGLRFTGFFQNKWYLNAEPRLAARYQLNPTTSLKGSYTSVYQYIHLLSNSGASLPTDFWYPSTENILPQNSRQVATGIHFLLGKSSLLLSNEVYYKWMDNMIDFKDGAQIFLNPDVEEELVFGRGWSYGNEIYLEKKKGKTTGWIGYTLSWTWRQFDQINRGNRFPGRQDRRHDLTLVLQHQLNDRFTFSMNWIFGSGSVTTLPVGRFMIQDIPSTGSSMVPEFIDRNTFRMANYHRLDLGLVVNLNPKWGTSNLTVGLYNVYSRRNPYFIYFNENKDANDQTVGFSAKQVSLFPIIPSITYNFEF
ncbi:MAG: TonB-dependent receptor [Candidatus Cyclobacteriaceae bacterium M3_2C_046]